MVNACVLWTSFYVAFYTRKLYYWHWLHFWNLTYTFVFEFKKNIFNVCCSKKIWLNNFNFYIDYGRLKSWNLFVSTHFPSMSKCIGNQAGKILYPLSILACTILIKYVSRHLVSILQISRKSRRWILLISKEFLYWTICILSSYFIWICW